MSVTFKNEYGIVNIVINFHRRRGPCEKRGGHVSFLMQTILENDLINHISLPHETVIWMMNLLRFPTLVLTPYPEGGEGAGFLLMDALQ